MDIIEAIRKLRNTGIVLRLEWEGQDLIEIPISTFWAKLAEFDIASEEDIDELDPSSVVKLEGICSNAPVEEAVYKYLLDAHNYGMNGGGYRVLADGLIEALVEQMALHAVVGSSLN